MLLAQPNIRDILRTSDIQFYRNEIFVAVRMLMCVFFKMRNEDRGKQIIESS